MHKVMERRRCGDDGSSFLACFLQALITNV
jgi:hypothetical protein